MPLNSVQQYVQSVVSGIQGPLYDTPLLAYITPPVQDNLTGPTAYIWGATWSESRQTAPRPGAFKKIIYQIEVYLKVPDAPDFALADSAFPSLIDAVVAALNTATMPIFITDSVTGKQSQLLTIGEVIAGDYSTLHVLEDQRWVVYECLLRCQVEEAVTYGS